jgi:SAM-dependent methyltransferase
MHVQWLAYVTPHHIILFLRYGIARVMTILKKECQVLLSLGDLDASIAALDSAAANRQDALNQGLGALGLDYAAFSPVPDDPAGRAYRAWQMDLYRRISKRGYNLANEAVDIDVASAVRRPYPYSTGDRATIGAHLKMMGFIAEHFDVAAGARVLEMGAGWGNLALMLAQSGYDVSACDLEERFVELIRARAIHEGVKIEAWAGDFLQSGHYDQRWGAIVFNACFHHCDDHQALLDMLVTQTALDVRLIFAGESVYDYYPWPWGINLAGQAVYCIRKFGWLELAFSERYFLRELMRRGVFARKSVACFERNLNIIVGRKYAATVGTPIPLSHITFLPEDEATFLREDSPSVSGRFTGALSTFSLIDPTIARLTISLLNPKTVTTAVTVRHAGQVQTITMAPGAAQTLSVDAYHGGTCVIEAETHQPSALGMSADARNLGVFVASITIDRMRA